MRVKELPNGKKEYIVNTKEAESIIKSDDVKILSITKRKCNDCEMLSSNAEVYHVRGINHERFDKLYKLVEEIKRGL